MTSRRPKSKPANIDFRHEALKDCFVTEPQRGQSNVAAMEKTALGSSTTNLIEQVVHWGNIQKAWKAVRANRGAPGPDGITINDFPNYFYQHWPRIWRQLLDGTYQPGASRRKSIQKKDGGERLLGIPNLKERLITQAISQILTPIFDPDFSESSFGYTLSCGRFPFEAESIAATLRKVDACQPPSISTIAPSIPSGLVAVIDRLMSRNPNDRFQSADEVADALRDQTSQDQKSTNSE